MCIIVCKPIGEELPSEKVLRNCFENNMDGLGFMYNKNDKVIIEKGYMRFEDGYKRLLELDKEIGFKDRGLVMHFRWSTSGKTDAKNCHPYPISNRERELRALDFITDIAVAHNGIVRGYIPKGNSVLNDTQYFIKDYLYGVYKKDKHFLTNEKTLFEIEVEVGSKLAFLESDGNITLIGKFIEEKDGCFYSNDGYLSYESLWSSWTTTPTETNKSSLGVYVDIKDYCDVRLDLYEFCELLEYVYYFEDGMILKLENGREVISSSCIVLDDYDNCYEVDYDLQTFTFLGELNRAYN